MENEINVGYTRIYKLSNTIIGFICNDIESQFWAF